MALFGAERGAAGDAGEVCAAAGAAASRRPVAGGRGGHGLRAGGAAAGACARRTPSEVAGGYRGAQSGPQVTIQVQAMDSRSFLDHSAEIAQAVREAMLNMHSLNDVVNDI